MSREPSSAPHLGRFRLLGPTLLIGATALAGLGGCASASTAQATLNPGTQFTSNELQGEDLKLVSEGEGEPARVLGLLTNLSTVPLEVTVRDADDTALLTVSAGDTFSFTDNPTILATTDVQVGQQALMTFTATADEEAVAVPVYEGPIGGYGDLVPGPPES